MNIAEPSTGWVSLMVSAVAPNLLLIEAMSKMVVQAQQAGRLPPEIHPFVTSTAMIAIVERLLPYRNEIARRGADAVAMRDTISALLYRSLTGY